MAFAPAKGQLVPLRVEPVVERLRRLALEVVAVLGVGLDHEREDGVGRLGLGGVDELLQVRLPRRVGHSGVHDVRHEHVHRVAVDEARHPVHEALRVGEAVPKDGLVLRHGHRRSDELLLALLRKLRVHDHEPHQVLHVIERELAPLDKVVEEPDVALEQRHLVFPRRLALVLRTALAVEPLDAPLGQHEPGAEQAVDVVAHAAPRHDLGVAHLPQEPRHRHDRFDGRRAPTYGVRAPRRLEDVGRHLQVPTRLLAALEARHVVGRRRARLARRRAQKP